MAHLKCDREKSDAYHNSLLRWGSEDVSLSRHTRKRRKARRMPSPVPLTLPYLNTRVFHIRLSLHQTQFTGHYRVLAQPECVYESLRDTSVRVLLCVSGYEPGTLRFVSINWNPRDFTAPDIVRV